MGVEPEDQPERGAERVIERQHRVRRDAGEERSRRVAVEPVAGQAARRAQRRQPEPQHRQRMSRHVDDRPEQLAAELPGIPHERPEQPPPRAAIRRPGAAAVAATDRSSTTAAPTVERVRDRRVRVDELDPARGQVDRGKNGEASVSGRIVEHMSWRNPGRVSSIVRVPPPGSSARLVDTDRAPGTGQGDGRGQAVRVPPRRRSRRPASRRRRSHRHGQAAPTRCRSARHPRRVIQRTGAVIVRRADRSVALWRTLRQ